MLTILDEIVKGEHTPDWGFYGRDGICKPSPILHKYYIWTCRCGRYVGSDTLDNSWTKFMVHKYGDEWTEKDKFDKLWDECFPMPNRTAVIRRVLANANSDIIAPLLLLLLSLYVMYAVFVVYPTRFR